MAKIILAFSSVFGAFRAATVGTRVPEGAQEEVLRLAEEAVAKFEFPPNGQGFIPCPEIARHVESGVGRRAGRVASDFHPVQWRGDVVLALKREFAAPAENAALIVYTRAAYEADPEVTAVEKKALGDATHVLVALLAFAGPKAPVDPWRFCCNAAGGNNAALAASADELRAEARAVVEYHRDWCVVADEELALDAVTEAAKFELDAAKARLEEADVRYRAAHSALSNSEYLGTAGPHIAEIVRPANAALEHRDAARAAWRLAEARLVR